MKIHQQLLTVISDESSGPIENVAQRMLKELFSEIRKNQSTRKEADLVHETHENPYALPVSRSSEKSKTKWERFAETKNIKKRKRSKLVYSEEYKAWLPRWGAKSPQNLLIRGGITENSSICQLKREKAEKVLKNKKNMLANKKRLD